MQHSLAKNKIQVLLLEGIHEKAVNAFHAAGYNNVKLLKGALEENELIEALKETHILGLRSRTQLTEKVLKSASKLMAAGCFCIGTNQVDLNVAQSQGIPVFNAPFSNTRSVAELVIGEMILLMRGVPEKSAALHKDGSWEKSAAGSFEVRGKTLGIVGYGHIGTQVATLAENLGMQVIFYDIESKLAFGNARSMPSLNSVLENADIVTFHVPETPLTEKMMGEKEFARMKKGGILINASRGTVVDIEALVKALETKHISGAAIDVFPTEPTSANEKLNSPLVGHSNVILTPHIGGSTKEAQENIAVEVADKLIKYSDNGSTLGAVNFPEVSLPSHGGSHRILHIHENKPGMLKALNEAFSSLNVNISGQYLQTKNGVGYVVTDVDKTTSKLSAESLKSLEGTIKARVLY